MTSNLPIVLKLLASSVSVASRAGKIVRDVMKKGELGIIEKGKDDYQTEADRSAQRCIIASLTKQFPNVTIIGEEGATDLEVPNDWLILNGDEDILKRKCPSALENVSEDDIVIWVDPLDGTSEYTQGALMLQTNMWERWKTYVMHPFITAKWHLSLLQADYGFLEHVTVLIGISVKQRPVGGIIHQPFYSETTDSGAKNLGRTIWGLDGLGVGGFTLAPPPSSLIVTTTRSHSNVLVESCLEALNPSEVLRVGGAGYKVLQLLEGKATVYVFASPGCKKWDTCAPEAVLTAAGGKLTDIAGSLYDYNAAVDWPNKTGVLAALTTDIHEEVLSKIPQALKDKLIQG